MKNNLVGIIFSKDRAMQLDATLRSFFLNCHDNNIISLIVIYTTSTISNEAQYELLKFEYYSILFINETHFKNDLLTHMSSFEYILFLVDDNIFVSEFSLRNILKSLDEQPDAIGFSLRLGRNTTYCYPMDRTQKQPSFHDLGHHILKFNWTNAELDFGYPLEVSSSIYRVRDLQSELLKLSFTNPNTFEVQLVGLKHLYASTKPSLLCYEQSVVFCAPINITQTSYPNRVGSNQSYTINSLGQMFRNKIRIDVNNYIGFIPNACHQEVELAFRSVPLSSFNRKAYWTFLYHKSLAMAALKKTLLKMKMKLKNILRFPYHWLRHLNKNVR
jgi:hypothetical protein